MYEAGYTTTYGSVTYPIEVGSCVDSRYVGGGAVRVIATSMVIIGPKGILSADGKNAGAGGGSGGSVLVIAPQILSDGLISANGGWTTHGSYGNGGGGRVALHADVLEMGPTSKVVAKDGFAFRPDTTVPPKAGVGWPGTVGTVFLSTKKQFFLDCSTSCLVFIFCF